MTKTRDADALMRRATDALAGADLAAAHQYLAQLSASTPGDMAVWYNLGVVRKQLGDRPGAVEALQTAAALQPDHIDVLLELGSLLMWERKPLEAEACFERLFKLAPSHPAAHNNLGHFARAAGQADVAEEQFRLALKADPAFVPAWDNLAGLCLELGRFAEAEEYVARSLALNPKSVNARVNQGQIRQARGDYRDAAASYHGAIQYAPRHALARVNLALMLLALGQFEEAWPHHAWREKRRNKAANQSRSMPPAPPPDLAALRAGDEIVLQGEQGLGDVLFFLRFAPLLAQREFRLHFRGDSRLHAMLSRTGLFECLLAADEVAPAGLPRLLVGDLPLALHTGYCGAPLKLAPSGERVEPMRRHLESLGPAPYVGVTWRAGTPSRVGATALEKEVSPAMLGAALAQAGGTLISVQREATGTELQAFSQAACRPVHDFSEVNAELEDALALMSLLDDYVCVSNTNLHLRAGCGRRASVLVPHPPEWRWMAAGDSSPWFPSLSIHRQTASQSWHQALADLNSDLAHRSNLSEVARKRC
jgi:tetratricopeptide (TPR) repeat protein